MSRSKDLDTVAPDDPIVETGISTNILEEPENEIPKINHPPKKEIDPMPDPKIFEILGHTKSSFSPFLVNPKVFDFTEREDNEINI